MTEGLSTCILRLTRRSTRLHLGAARLQLGAASWRRLFVHRNNRHPFVWNVSLILSRKNHGRAHSAGSCGPTRADLLLAAGALVALGGTQDGRTNVCFGLGTGCRRLSPACAWRWVTARILLTWLMVDGKPASPGCPGILAMDVDLPDRSGRLPRRNGRAGRHPSLPGWHPGTASKPRLPSRPHQPRSDASSYPSPGASLGERRLQRQPEAHVGCQSRSLVRPRPGQRASSQASKRSALVGPHRTRRMTLRMILPRWCKKACISRQRGVGYSC